MAVRKYSWKALVERDHAAAGTDGRQHLAYNFSGRNFYSRDVDNWYPDNAIENPNFQEISPGVFTPWVPTLSTATKDVPGRTLSGIHITATAGTGYLTQSVSGLTVGVEYTFAIDMYQPEKKGVSGLTIFNGGVDSIPVPVEGRWYTIEETIIPATSTVNFFIATTGECYADSPLLIKS